MALLAIEGLSVGFAREGRFARVIPDLTYSVEAGETLGIVGESGSGKSVHALALLGLLPQPPGRILGGRAVFDGHDLLAMPEARLRDLRGGRIGMIFQDPMTALNPVLTIGRQIAEPLIRHKAMSMRQALDRATDLLALVGIRDGARRLSQYPHEFSGGMRQRVMIAIAISCEPALLIADEPTTALDVTVQGQILDLMAELRDRLRMTMVWITHDMGVVAGIADTIQVMYAGRIMERGPVNAVFASPRSAYTYGLLQSLPHGARPPGGRLMQIPGAPPDMFAPTPGDPFAPRNPFATPRCHREAPPLRAVEDSVAGHMVAAWYDLPRLLA
ncbi:ABC transporter ATP-binding protein [Falsiroseomonas stagni]|uniref:Peptide/nickel transport system ATP-binding protein n=1 Tax=Falsiroseomonas stagni DSM 19981 TaxID=1123062 RepID=A0A1I4DWS3_9PROT|nr:ABC transporter ATP-binding protein [Falsiroseomonas stagni]SFK96351.1 peptide/nickel transport system ATP-binding protein [Falsiroseomonas stagni DSM 19981]